MQVLIFLLLSWLIPQSIAENTVQEPSEGTGNHRIALTFTNHNSFVPSTEQLRLSQEAGITLLEVSDTSPLSHADVQSFSLLYNLGIRYTTISSLKANVYSIIDESITNYQEFSSEVDFNIVAVNLFFFPDDFNIEFVNIASSVADSVGNAIQKPLYYQSSQYKNLPFPENFSFVSEYFQTEKNIFQNLFTPATRFVPSDNYLESIKALETLLINSLSLEETVIIIPAEWFFDALEKQPVLTSVFSDYASGHSIAFPYPAVENPSPDPNWEVIFLLLILTGLIAQHKYQPVSIQYVNRYFFNNSFFVTDIMEGRLRNITPALLFLGVHCIINGLFIFTLLELFISHNGFSVLSHYSDPFLPLTLQPVIIGFFSAIIALLIHSISVLWLFLLNKKMNQLNKVLNLYTWPFILHLLCTVVLVVLNQITHPNIIAYIIIALYLLTWFLGFGITAVNGARFLDKNRVLNLLLTIGIYGLISIGIVTFLILSPQLIDIIKLAVLIP